MNIKLVQKHMYMAMCRYNHQFECKKLLTRIAHVFAYESVVSLQTLDIIMRRKLVYLVRFNKIMVDSKALQQSITLTLEC